MQNLPRASPRGGRIFIFWKTLHLWPSINILISMIDQSFLFLYIDHSKLIDRVRVFLWDALSYMRTTLVNLNVFPRRAFGSNIDPLRAKYLGQLATRLYLVLLIGNLIILTIYTIFEPRLITKTFTKPSYDLYTHLIHNHNDTLQCPCSLASSVYDRYTEIKPIFHQVNIHKNHSYFVFQETFRFV